MMKLFMLLCAVLMFFGIAGCPSDKPVTANGQSNFSSAPVTASEKFSTGDNPSAVPEASTLIMLGSGLVGLAEFGRKLFRKYKSVGSILPDNGGRRKSQFAYNSGTPDRRSGKERRSGFDRRLKQRTTILEDVSQDPSD
jgi:PEP-CTERM motif